LSDRRDHPRGLTEAHGGAGRYIAAWPDDKHVRLLDELRKQGDRLGGDTGMFFLRAICKPSFVLSKDVIAALIPEGVLSKPPSGKRDLIQIQEAFNRWTAESGRDMTTVSRLLAMSIGAERAHGEIGDSG
jgi:hypothetical protein